MYENRSAQSGRIISLRVVVLRATHRTHGAIGSIEGGPGVPSVPDAPYYADGNDKVFSALRERYDVLFVDNRGMGDSNPSNCDFAPRQDPASYFLQLWPDRAVSSCRERYATRSDLSMYNTENAVDDLDDVRAALGYPKLVLLAGSYGTYFATVFMRQHPNHVESAVLSGVTTPHFVPIPGSPDGSQTAFDDLTRRCRVDSVCSAHFPAFAQHFNVLVQRFDRGPIALKYREPKTKQSRQVRLSKEVFVDRVREGMYAADLASYLPYIIESAYRNNYGPLSQLIEFWSQALDHLQDPGANLSYSCAEWIPFISESELKAAAGGSFAGDLRVRAQQRACKIWHVKPMPPSFDEPVRSAVPSLLISGSDDPATPPRYAEQELPYLSQGKQILVRGAGHATDNACTARLTLQFVRARSVKALDVTACSASFKPPRFKLSMAGWP